MREQDWIGVRYFKTLSSNNVVIACINKACTLLTGRLVSGDCKKNIHVWEPREGGTSWQIDQRPFSSHTKSVEDLQWSPTEATVCLYENRDVVGQTEEL